MSTLDQASSAREQARSGEASRGGNQSSTAANTGQRRRVWRLEVGFFIRKIVNRRVVSEWQFPRWRRLQAGQHSGSGEPVLQQASAAPLSSAHDTGGPPAGEPRTLAMQSTATEEDDDGSTSEETRLEAGFFVQSATPPEYMDPPDG